MNNKQVNKIGIIRQSQTRKIYFEVRASALCPRLHHYKGFHNSLMDLPQRALQQGITTT